MTARAQLCRAFGLITLLVYSAYYVLASQSGITIGITLIDERAYMKSEEKADQQATPSTNHAWRQHTQIDAPVIPTTPSTWKRLEHEDGREQPVIPLQDELGPKNASGFYYTCPPR
eukprot:2994085-Amphidinium_carterae.1